MTLEWVVTNSHTYIKPLSNLASWTGSLYALILIIFPHVNVTALLRELSNHCSILLCTSKLDISKTPFSFFNSWMNRDVFVS